MNDALAMLVPALAIALLQFLWQGAVLGMLTALALALLRNARPQARYAIACAALLACVALPAWTVLAAVVGTDAPQAVTRSTSALSAAMSATPGAVLQAVSSPSGETLPWIAALWASGVALLSLRMACGLLWVRRLCHAAEAPAARWQACVDRLAPQFGIARSVALRVTHEGFTPVTAGWWRPVVLLPLGIATRMPADLIEALIAHELAHVRRHDYLVNLLQGAAEALLFYHPVVWWLSRRIRIERELVADDLAATVLGDRRRLAVALSELDRHQAPARSPTPSPCYAPAAHGGHLMSRIQQLIRPQHRALSGALALPLLGLAVAGATFYAHAQLAPPAERTAPAAAAKPLPAPTAKPGARIVATAAESRADRSSFALVQGDRDGITMHGSTDDIEDIESARDGIDGDFVWFRRDGKAWVLRDAQTVARVREAWAGTDALNAQMQGLEARMRPHNERMEALGARMEALSADNVMESPEAKAALAKMGELGRKAGTLGQRQAALGLRLSTASKADTAQLEAEQAELEREQDALEREMERYQAAIESFNERMEAQHRPLEALGREMEAASRPMEAIGREMEALGKRLEREAERADAQVRQLLDDAYRNGGAEPAPVRR